MLRAFITACLVAVLAMPVFAQQQKALAGYTDKQGNLNPTGDTQIAFSDIMNNEFTVTLSRLHAFDNQGQRIPSFNWNGATVFMMPLGDAYGDTGPNVENVNLAKAVGRGVVSNNAVTLILRRNGFDCSPVNWITVEANGRRAWLGHPGWARTNSAAGPWLVLAEGKVGPQGDHKYPATVYCQSGNKIVAPNPEAKAKFAKYIQTPSPGSREAIEEARKAGNPKPPADLGKGG